MSNASDPELLSAIRERARTALVETLGRDSGSVILVGTPRHRNLGDTFIWDGNLRLMEEVGLDVICDTHWIPLSRIRDTPEAILVEHGGGSLGDLYMAEEERRRILVRTFPHRRIVFMPQSVHYRSREELQVSRDIYQSAPSLTILARDERSLSWLKENMPGIDAQYCPDLAFGMRRLNLKVPSGRGRTLTVARSDSESTQLDRSVVAPDWTFSSPNKLRWQMALAPRRVEKRLPLDLPRWLTAWGQSEILSANLSAAHQLFSGVSVVATNRLHVHIFCAIHDIPHFVADNSYGKIGSIFNEYSGAFNSAHWCDSLSEAQARAASFTL